MKKEKKQPRREAAQRSKMPQQRYKVARRNLIAMVALTVINMFALQLDLNFAFYFSASLPDFLISLLNKNLLGIALSLIFMGLFVLCWLLSKKSYIWLIAALVLFAFDTLITALGIIFLLRSGSYETTYVGEIMEISFHVIVLAYLIDGVIAGRKLQEPEAEEAAVQHSDLTRDTREADVG